jgi:hypothetical protein
MNTHFVVEGYEAVLIHECVTDQCAVRAYFEFDPINSKTA